MNVNYIYNDDCRLHVDEFSNMKVCIVKKPCLAPWHTPTPHT